MHVIESECWNNGKLLSDIYITIMYVGTDAMRILYCGKLSELTPKKKDFNWTAVISEVFRE